MRKAARVGLVFALLMPWAGPLELGSARVAQAKPPLLPPEMIAACAKIAVGDACTLSMGGRSLQGTCLELPDHSRACRPDARGKASADKPPKGAPKPAPAR